MKTSIVGKTKQEYSNMAKRLYLDKVIFIQSNYNIRYLVTLILESVQDKLVQKTIIKPLHINGQPIQFPTYSFREAQKLCAQLFAHERLFSLIFDQGIFTIIMKQINPIKMQEQTQVYEHQEFENQQQAQQQAYQPIINTVAKILSTINKFHPIFIKLMRYSGLITRQRSKFSHIMPPIKNQNKHKNHNNFRQQLNNKKYQLQLNKQIYTIQKSNQLKSYDLFKISGVTNIQTADKIKKEIENNDTNLYVIEEITVHEEENNNKIVGGLGEVMKVKVDEMKVVSSGGVKMQMKNKIMARKRVIRKQYVIDQMDEQIAMKMKNKNFSLQQRYQNQLDIIQHLCKTGRKPYLLNYYIQNNQNSQNQFYMQHMQLNLSEFLFYYGQNMSQTQIIDICIKLVSIVIDLHKHGVVHRDIKPSNIMVRYDFSKQEADLKIIDFSDSYILQSKKEIQLFGTLPYSPIQCSKNNKKNQKYGYNCKEIDYWSVGVMISEIYFGVTRLSYSSAFSRDIHNLWENQLQHCFTNQPAQGCRNIIKCFEQLRISLVQPKQQKRMNLNKALSMLLAIKQYHQKILEQCLENGLQKQISITRSSSDHNKEVEKQGNVKKRNKTNRNKNRVVSKQKLGKVRKDIIGNNKKVKGARLCDYGNSNSQLHNGSKYMSHT